MKEFVGIWVMVVDVIVEFDEFEKEVMVVVVCVGVWFFCRVWDKILE